MIRCKLAEGATILLAPLPVSFSSPGVALKTNELKWHGKELDANTAA